MRKFFHIPFIVVSIAATVFFGINYVAIRPLPQFKSHGTHQNLIHDSSILYVNGDFLKNNNLNGQNVKIGIIDVGFRNADTNVALRHVFDQGRVIAVKDFVNPMKSNFFETKNWEDDHGTAVFKYIAGVDSAKLYGL